LGFEPTEFLMMGSTDSSGTNLDSRRLARSA
jgi:hypothetical protein